MRVADYHTPDYAVPALPISGERTPWWPVLFSLPYPLVKSIDWYLATFVHSWSTGAGVQKAITFGYLAGPVVSVIGVAFSIAAICFRRRVWQQGLIALLANLLSLLVMAIAGVIYFFTNNRFVG